MFNLGNESADKARSIVDNTGRALVNKKVLIFGSKETDTINNTGCYDTYKDIFWVKRSVKKTAPGYTISKWSKGMYQCKTRQTTMQ